MGLGEISFKYGRFMGVAEVKIQDILSISRTGFVGLLPESEFCGYLMIIRILPITVWRGTRQTCNIFVLKLTWVSRGRGDSNAHGVRRVTSAGQAPFKA